MDKSIIIIGAGIAGLSAGCYGQMNGYKTQIFEMHDKPGGLCTSWKRKGYTVDGCLHWLVGSAPGNTLHRFWEEVGAVQNRSIVDHEEFARIEGKEGQVFILYTDIARLGQHMKELAPEDSEVIVEFISAINALTRFNMMPEKAFELFSPIDSLKMMVKMVPFLGLMRKWGKLTIQDFAQRFRNPFLCEAFPLVFDLPEFSMIGVLMTFAWLHSKNAGYPIGGSLEFARSIERRYLDLGGQIHCKSPVTKILVENDRAVGVRLVDGTEHRSDMVISAADGHTTIFDMLEGKYINDKIRKYYEQLPIFPPLVYLALGVARSFDEVPQTVSGISFPFDEPLTIAGYERQQLVFQVHRFDPTLAPPGKSVVRVMFNSDYEYWKKLKEDTKLYKAEKKQIADTVIAQLDRRFPGLKDQVEMWDVATPMTFERYTGNWQGTYEGWLLTPKTMRLRMSKTLPGLENFYMVGQWVSPGGGLPSGVITGNHVIQIICKRDKKPFITTLP